MSSGASVLDPAQVALVDAWVHRMLHLTASRGRLPYAEATLVAECWGYPIGAIPDWAVAALAAGEPASAWCPVVRPDLTLRGLPESSPERV